MNICQWKIVNVLPDGLGKAIARIQATATVFMKPPPEIFATWPTEPCGGKPVPLRSFKVRQHVLFDSSFVQYASPSI